MTSPRRSRDAASALLLLLLALLGGALAFASPEREKAGYNVVVILNDALSAKHLHCYGYDRRTSRAVDRLASGGVLFENCMSQAWYTLPSHASLFTSKYVPSHKVTKNTHRLAEGETTLAGVLKAHGYKTAAFTGGIFLEPVYGLDQGFDTYYSSTAERTAAHPELFPLSLGKSEFIVPKAIRWLEENRNERFFLFVHFYDLFMPAQLPEGIRNRYDARYRGPASALLRLRQLHLQRTSRKTYFLGKKTGGRVREIRLDGGDLAHLTANYDEALLFSDVMVGRLLEKLDALDLTRKTLIVFTSDHGTDLMEHGTMHLYMDGSAYDEVLHVPLVVKCPGAAAGGVRSKAQVQLIDVMPTILDVLGIPVNREAEGRSLLRDLKGAPRAGGIAFGGWESLQAVRTDAWKLIYSFGKFELYDLRKDPGERKNVAEGRPEVFLDLVKRLLTWNAGRGPGEAQSRIRLSRELIRKLREAGYW